MFTLTPAYGRDYKSKAQIEADLVAGKDFVANDYNGRSSYIGLEELHSNGIASVNVRYGALRKVCILKVGPLVKRLLDARAAKAAAPTVRSAEEALAEESAE